MSKVDFHAILQTIIDNLTRTGSWVKEWKLLSQRNLDGTAYRGFNQFSLAATQQIAEFSSSSWGTFRAIQRLGGRVRKGARGTQIVFWKLEEPKRFIDRGEEEGEEEDRPNPRRHFVLKVYRVFNRDQTEGLPAEEEVLPEPPEELEEIWRGCQDRPTLVTGEFNPSYSEVSDTIRMPLRSRFTSDEAYYGALFHELTHSTGHVSRLNRKSLYQYHADIPTRSREELVAEIGSILLLARGHVSPRRNDQNYINSWITFLENKPKEAIQAFYSASRAYEFVVSRLSNESKSVSSAA